MVHSRVVCCCGVDRWAILIALVQMVTAVIAAAIIFPVFYGVLGHESTGWGLLLCWLVLIVLCLSAAIVAVFLLVGAEERRSRLLNVWLLYSLICLAGVVLLNILGLLQAHDGLQNIFHIVALGISVIGFLFSIWVVWTFKREVDLDTGKSGQPV